MEHWIVNGGVTKLAVSLDRPVFFSASVSFRFLLLNGSILTDDRFAIEKSTLTWRPGEAGIKYFIIRDKMPFHEQQKRMLFLGVLVNGLNCDFHTTQYQIKLKTMKEEKLPLFRVSNPRVRIQTMKIYQMVINPGSLSSLR